MNRTATVVGKSESRRMETSFRNPVPGSILGDRGARVPCRNCRAGTAASLNESAGLCLFFRLTRDFTLTRMLIFILLFVCLFIPFNVLCKSTTIVGRQILRSGFDPETHSKGPPNSRITYEPLYTSSDGQKIFRAGAQSTLLRTLLANINRLVAYVKPLSKKSRPIF